jgi:peptidyl-prolyl cis-trans isomerase A (cyclophilin A)
MLDHHVNSDRSASAAIPDSIAAGRQIQCDNLPMFPRNPISAALAAALALLVGCSRPTETKQEEAAQPKEAPAVYRAQFVTGKGEFTVEVTRAWAPLGADRFYALVSGGFYNGARFFRVRPGFVVQWGIHRDPKTNHLWSQLTFPDDPVKQTNARGTITFATSGPASRTTQVFINLVDNARLDASGFAPFGRVVSGMEVVDKFYSGYGEGAPRGDGPDQDKIATLGNAYLEREFPRLDFIEKAAIIK